MTYIIIPVFTLYFGIFTLPNVVSEPHVGFESYTECEAHGEYIKAKIEAVEEDGYDRAEFTCKAFKLL